MRSRLRGPISSTAAAKFSRPTCKSPSLYAEPRKLIDVEEAVELLTATLPDLDAKELRARLSSKRGFVWLKREITPEQQREIHRLGIPGIGFLTENKRDYPNGPRCRTDRPSSISTTAASPEWRSGSTGRGSRRCTWPALPPIACSGRSSFRSICACSSRCATNSSKAREKFKAKAASGLVLNVNTGEIVAMVSEPDYDPNNPREANDPTRINRLTTGVYEMGSTFKALTIAMAIDSGKVDAHIDLRRAHAAALWPFAIHDFEPQHRFLSVPEIFTYSSNIGAARMALAVGVDGHKAFLKKMGQLDRLRTELPESAEPIVPKHWGELNTVTIAFGHGLSVAPLQAAMGVAATDERRPSDPADLP